MTQSASSRRKTSASASKAEASAGGVVFKRSGSQILLCLVLDRYGCWTCPKGHIEPGESTLDAALREIREEVGLRNLDVLGNLGVRRYHFTRGTRIIGKRVHWLLMRAQPRARLKPNRAQHILDAQWLPVQEAIERSGYAGVRSLLRRAAAKAGETCRNAELA